MYFDVWIRHFHSLSDISSDTYERGKSDNHPQFNWEQDRELEEHSERGILLVYCYCKYSLPFLYKSISLVYFTVQLNNQNQCMCVDKFETLSHSEFSMYQHQFTMVDYLYSKLQISNKKLRSRSKVKVTRSNSSFLVVIQ